MSNSQPEFVRDEFLATDADSPVYGFNLACAFPFPAHLESPYNTLAKNLEALDEGVYVYPFWETHVTLMTFVNFSKHRNPSAGKAVELAKLIAPVGQIVKTLFDNIQWRRFQLDLGAPQLSAKAVILPGTNETGEIAAIRGEIKEALAQRHELREALSTAGFNVPGIIHSTILRFREIPRNAGQFKSGFETVAKSAPHFSLAVNEIFLTTETKPYMRGGQIVHRFPLAG